MRILGRNTVLSFLVLCLCWHPALAAEKVAFETPAVPPSAFKLKRAKAEGKTVEPTPGIRLTGLLSKPHGDGPHPAIIVLDEGENQQDASLAWATLLAEKGYVTLFIESFAARGGSNFQNTPTLDMTVDAQSGHRFLNSLGFVDGKKIGLLGFGRSGWFVQRALDASIKDQPGNTAFNAGAALYPHCDPDTQLLAPVLILAGQEDAQMSLATCQKMAKANEARGLAMEMHVYRNGSHYFDNRNYSRNPADRREGWSQPADYDQGQYDPEIHADAQNRIISFFEKHLR